MLIQFIYHDQNETKDVSSNMLRVCVRAGSCVCVQVYGMTGNVYCVITASLLYARKVR